MTDDRDDLDDRLTGALREHVRDVDADAELLERIGASVAAEGAGRPAGDRRPWWLLGAAAAVVAVFFVWQGFGGQDDEALVAGETDPPTVPTTAPAPATTGTTSTTALAPSAAALPDRAVIAFTSADGLTAELVLVDLTDGSAIATIDSVDNSDCGEIGACYVSYASTAVSGLRDLFVETCCEPAGGDVPRYQGLDPDTGETIDREQFLGGYEPVVHPSGRRVATAGQASIEIRDLPSLDAHSISILDGDSAVFPTGLVWSPDGSQLAVSLEDADGFRLVVVPADAASIDDGAVVAEWTDRRAVQAWTADGRLWLLHADDGSQAFPVSTMDPETGATARFEVLAREVVADRTGQFLYVVTNDGLHRADARATSTDELLGPVVVAAGDRVLGAVSVFSSTDCAAGGEPVVTVPDVVGSPLPVAIEALEAAGLQVVGHGTHSGDPTGADAVVSAQEPPAGEAVPAGSCVGLRTTRR